MHQTMHQTTNTIELLKSRSYRYVQSTLLFLLVFSFMVYLITFIADMINYYNDKIGYFISTLIINIISMIGLVFAIRGVALEIIQYVILYAMVTVMITISHLIAFSFRNPLFNSFNFLNDALITGLVIWFASIMYKDSVRRGIKPTIIPNIMVISSAENNDVNVNKY